MRWPLRPGWDRCEFSDETRVLINATGVATRKTVDILAGPPDPQLAGHLTASVVRLTAAATAVVAGAGTICILWSPAANIISTIDSRTGNIRLECLHTQPHQHCWDLSGIRMAC